MIAAALFGAAALLGVVVAWAGLHPGAEPLTAVLGRLGRPLPPMIETENSSARWTARLADTVSAQRYLVPLASDLRVQGRSREDEIVALGAQVVAGLVSLPVIAFALALVGIGLPSPLVLLGVLVVGGVTVAGHWSGVRNKAASRRDEFRYALSAFCDLTVMNLAAGRGVSQALETAAGQGEGWAFTELRAALAAAYQRGSPGSAGLERLGVELEIDDLIEVAGSIRLAGENGAAVRSTLRSKARTIRERLTADAEAKAAVVTERMGLPAAVVLLGLVAFYVFPAIDTLLNP
jgi:Flp pilus assembly protein TadB